MLMNIVYVCVCWRLQISVFSDIPVEHNGSGVELRTLDFENPGLNPVLRW